MREYKTIVETQAENADIPQWQKHYNNLMPALKDGVRDLEEAIEAIRAIKREHSWLVDLQPTTRH